MISGSPLSHIPLPGIPHSYRHQLRLLGLDLILRYNRIASRQHPYVGTGERLHQGDVMPKIEEMRHNDDRWPSYHVIRFYGTSWDRLAYGLACHVWADHGPIFSGPLPMLDPLNPFLPAPYPGTLESALGPSEGRFVGE